MANELTKKILNANIKVHRLESKYYDQIHREIFNNYEQKRIECQLTQILIKLNNKRKLKILDVGSGTGNLSAKLIKILKNQNYEIDALDISKEMQDVMKRKFRNIKFINYYLDDLDNFIKKSNKEYDLIVISSVLHHLPNYYVSLQKLLGILKNQGIIYLTHEPLHLSQVSKNSRFKLIEFLDYKLFQLYILKMILSKKYKFFDYSFSDYHTNEKALNPKKIKQFLCEKTQTKLDIKIKKYSTGYFFPHIKNKFGVNCFELIIYKTPI